MSEGVRAMLMRGGTSKGLYFVADDLPADPAARDALLLSLMGSPDPRQIDGLGGATPLTSKVAVIGPPTRPDADVDYLFLQVAVDRAHVTDRQNCGNILAGVAPFAVERGLVAARDPVTPVRIHMVNTGQIALAEAPTPGGAATYAGDARIDGVPGAHAAIPIYFDDLAGSSCGALLPTGRPLDQIDGVACTLIDYGMPCVLTRAADLGVSGYETPEALEANAALKTRLERIRLEAGRMMNLGDVAATTVPKMFLLAPPLHGGAIHTRAFIPHDCHRTIGLFAAVTVAAACLLKGTVAAPMAAVAQGARVTLAIEHPTGAMDVVARLGPNGVESAGVVRTARKLFDGAAFPREAQP